MTYGGEGERVNLDTESRDVLLLEFTSQMALDECGLPLRLAGGLESIERMAC